MKRPLMGAGIALVAGVAAAINGISVLWTGMLILLLNVFLRIRTESSRKYILGLSVLFFVGFCRTMMAEPTEILMENQVCGRVLKVQEKENSRWIYLKTDKAGVVVVVSDESNRAVPCYKGQILTVSGTAEAFSEPKNPGQFDEYKYYRSKGMDYKIRALEIRRMSEGHWFWRRLRFLEVIRAGMADFYRETMSGSGAGVISAAVLGERSGFQSELRRYYQENGWMHLVTTSGLHLSFIAMSLYRRLRKSTVSILPSTLISLVTMAAYGYMTDFGDSMLRAMGMMVFLLAAKLLGRRMDIPTALALTAAVLLLLRPARLYSSGFWLSFGAVAGMETGKYLWYGIRGGPPKGQDIKGAWLVRLRETFYIQAGIFLVTLPVVLLSMYEVPILGFFYNFFMIPMISLIVPVAFIAGLIGISRLPVVYGAAVGVLKVIDWVLGWIHRLPAMVCICGCPAGWQVVLFVLLSAGAVFFCRVKRGIPSIIILVLSCLMLMFVRMRTDKILCLDVGQGDAICILGANGSAVLVDGGSSDVSSVYVYRIEPVLKYYGVQKIDAWFLSHGDKDHVSGISEAMTVDGIPIGRMIVPPVSGDEALEDICKLAEEKRIPVDRLWPGDRLYTGNFSLTSLYPEETQASGDTNNASLVLALERTVAKQTFRMLFMGDLEQKGEQALMARMDLPDCDILKVGHHGSSGASSMAFLEEVSPEWAIISCGENNRYGHPHAETLERLAKVGCRYVTTARQGAVTVTFSRNGFQVSGYLQK